MGSVERLSVQSVLEPWGTEGQGTCSIHLTHSRFAVCMAHHILNCAMGGSKDSCYLGHSVVRTRT